MSIEERLEDMEREVGRQKRRSRWLLGAILVLAGGLVAAGVFKTMIIPAQAQTAGTAKFIRARSILVEDENGKLRASLTVDKDGPALRLWNEKGEGGAVLIVGKDGPWLTFYDEKSPRVLLMVDKGGPWLGLFDENGKTRAWLAVDKDGPALRLRDENDKLRAWLAVDKDGPWLTLGDENGKSRFVAGKTKTVSPDGKTIEYPESSLILYGPDGKIIWSAIK